MGLTLRLLGPPEVVVDGQPLVVDTRKATALLALLALRGDKVGRDVAATMFWPDAPPDRARAALRRTLSSLTSGLSARWVVSDRDTLSLDLDDPDVHADVAALRAAARTLRAHDATHGGDADRCPTCHDVLADLGHIERPLLEGFRLRETPAFDEWVQVEAESLRRDAATALDRLSAMALASGDAQAALDTASRWLAADRLHEAAHRAVMRAAAALGHRDDAIRQYRECVAILDHELGVTPLPETTALYRELLGEVSGSVAVPVPARAPTPRPARPARPLVDRDAELATLQEVHRGLREGAACVAIEGEAGIGKTRIAEEFVEYVAARGSHTVTVTCRDGESGLACGPLIDLLRDAVERDPAWVDSLPPLLLAEVARIVPELAIGQELPRAGALESPGTQARFLDSIFSVVAAVVAGPEPGVVVIDDLHWADPTTLDVLARGLRRHRGAPLLVIVAWRTELVEHDDPIRRLLRDENVTAVSPGRLTRDEVAELVAGPQVEDALVDRLFAETEGIPFFVVQYLASMADGDWDLPRPVRELVAARLAPLSDLARQCLTAGAILGRSFDLVTLVRTSGRSEDEVVAALDELLQHHLLAEHRGRTTGNARYDFAHTKIREVTEATASLARRRLLHRRAAEAILAASTDPADAARVAHHYREAGEDALAADHYARAGAHARSLFANVEATEHLQAALALGHPDVAALQLALGDLHALSGRYGDARDIYTAAAARFTEPDRAAEVEHRLGVLHLRWGDWHVAAGHLERALVLLGDGQPSWLLARAHADHAAVRSRLGDRDTATAEAAEAVRIAEACGDHRAIAEAHNAAGLIARHAGRLGDARDHLRDALTHAERSTDPSARVAALNNLALVLGADGRTDEALVAATEALKLCAEIGDRHREAALHSNLADLLHAAGRTDAALPHLTESARLLAHIGDEARPEPEVWKLTDW